MKLEAVLYDDGTMAYFKDGRTISRESFEIAVEVILCLDARKVL